MFIGDLSSEIRRKTSSIENAIIMGELEQEAYDNSDLTSKELEKILAKDVRSIKQDMEEINRILQVICDNYSIKIEK